jgi:transcription termination/antitermination protein NusA
MIDKAIVIEAMEDAIQRAARARYGAENDIRAKLDPSPATLRLWRVVEVVEEVEDYFKQVASSSAQKLQPGARSATSSSIRCRRSTSAGSPRRAPSR